MSGHDNSRSQRHALPPIRDILSDQFPQRSASPYRFDDVRGALPSLPSRGHSGHNSHHSISTLHPGHGPSSSSRHLADGHYPPRSYSHQSSNSSTNPTSHLPPSTRASQPYSFDVFRPSESGGLIHASSSTRSQGILRSTRADAGRRYTDEEADDVNDLSKRYACEVCGRRFARPSSLKAHEVSHTDERPHVCPYPGCGRAFGIPSNMRRHYRNAHEGRPDGSGSSGDYMA